MNVKEAINLRRSYRSLIPCEITKNVIMDLAECACFAPSCKNSQPWRFVFVYDRAQVDILMTAINPPNDKWVKNGSMIIAVFSNLEFDCIIKERLYYLFDTGLATAFLILRATELGLVAHPIAGFEEGKVKKILEIPDLMRVITLIIVGKKAPKVDSSLTELMTATELNKPVRLKFREFAYLNKYTS